MRRSYVRPTTRAPLPSVQEILGSNTEGVNTSVKVRSPRVGTAASFQQATCPEKSIEEKKTSVVISKVQISRKGKAWKKPTIIKSKDLSPIRDLDESEGSELDNQTHTVEFFYVQKRIYLHKETEQTGSRVSGSSK